MKPKTAKKTTPASPALSHSEQQAWAQLESICERVKALENNTGKAFLTAREAILQDPLCVNVRSDWYGVQGGSESGKAPAEFAILFCSGHSTLRIVGKLENGEPTNPRIEHQNQGASWTAINGLTHKQYAALLTYCGQFYFGD